MLSLIVNGTQCLEDGAPGSNCQNTDVREEVIFRNTGAYCVYYDIDTLGEDMLVYGAYAGVENVRDKEECEPLFFHGIATVFLTARWLRLN